MSTIISKSEISEQFIQDKIDEAIEKAEREIEQGANPIPVREAMNRLNGKIENR